MREPVDGEPSSPDDGQAAAPHATPLDVLFPDVYQELRVVARRQLANRAWSGTLSTAGLVHEAYLRLVARHTLTWNDRGHFVALAALAMRHVLVDRARARMTQKRDGERFQVTLDESSIAAADQPEVLVRLSEALDELGRTEPRLARVVDCRFFGGMSENEVAEALQVTTRTVQRDWAKARMLIRRAMST